jgi:hypothetical protein
MASDTLALRYLVCDFDSTKPNLGYSVRPKAKWVYAQPSDTLSILHSQIERDLAAPARVGLWKVSKVDNYNYFASCVLIYPQPKEMLAPQPKDLQSRLKEYRNNLEKFCDNWSTVELEDENPTITDLYGVKGSLRGVKYTAIVAEVINTPKQEQIDQASDGEGQGNLVDQMQRRA